jgi:hypothetical protein
MVLAYQAASSSERLFVVLCIQSPGYSDCVVCSIIILKPSDSGNVGQQIMA